LSRGQGAAVCATQSRSAFRCAASASRWAGSREVARLAEIGPKVEQLLGIFPGGTKDVGETGGAHEQAVRARFAGH
jgi:hypothetical protein